jgi:hypothetical protein
MLGNMEIQPTKYGEMNHNELILGGMVMQCPSNGKTWKK